MNAIDTLKQRSNKRIIEQNYIQNVLAEEANKIKQAQDKIFSNRNTSSVIRNSRSFIITNNKLTHRHDIRQRYEDMKKVRNQRQKSTKAHNKLIWGHYNNIVFKLAYGFTEDVKKLIAKNYQINL